MDIKEAIDRAGGATNIVTAFGNRGIVLTQPQVSTWKLRNTLPRSEWFGTTSYAVVICELIRAMGCLEVSPIDLCPGAGQYMTKACVRNDIDPSSLLLDSPEQGAV